MKSHHPEGRFADWSNPPKPRWRDAFAALLAPATRVHQYRNLRSSAFYEAMCEFDQKSKQ